MATNEHKQKAISTLSKGIDLINSYRVHTATESNALTDAYSPKAPPNRRPSAVLVVLRYNSERQFEDCWDVLLTLRTAQLRSHSGVVCLPGGRSEDGEDPVCCALREAEEEVGLHAEDVEVVGMYTPTASINRDRIYTVLSVLKKDAVELCRNPSEVEDIFWMPLSEFLRAENYRGNSFPYMIMRYFDYCSPQTNHIYSVWGLTARLLIVTAQIAYSSYPEYIDTEQTPLIDDPLFTGFISSKL